MDRYNPRNTSASCFCLWVVALVLILALPGCGGYSSPSSGGGTGGGGGGVGGTPDFFLFTANGGGGNTSTAGSAGGNVVLKSDNAFSDNAGSQIAVATEKLGVGFEDNPFEMIVCNVI